MTEIINQTDQEIADANKETRSQHRIKELSDKVELTSKERDELVNLRDKDQKKIAELERENAFNSGFADILGTHGAAKDFKDKIKEKVMGGYTVEDATFAILGKEGKLGVASEPTTQIVAGGSAANTQPTGPKEIKDMTQQERRDILSKELIWQ